MSDEFIDNTQKSRFEYHTAGAIVFANYRLKESVLFIDYVEAPVELRGSGAAGKLMEYIVQTAKQHSFKVHPICGYAASWLRRHPEYQELMD
jgi:predicted GNAT family acetyltransferase